MANNIETEGIEYDPHQCALLAKGSMVVQGRKQVEVAKKLNMNRVLLNLYLNRKINFLSKDIRRLLVELGIEEKGFRLSRRENNG
jgi:hypothetical protein